MMEEASVDHSSGEATRLLMDRSCWMVCDDQYSHFFVLSGPVGVQLVSVLRNSPFSVICREEVLLGDKPFRCEVAA